MQTELFEIPLPGLFAATYLAEVASVDDPEHLARVQVRLLNCDGIDGQNSPVWARVATPFAGSKSGAFFIPDVGDEVLVLFVQGDSRAPVVVGSLWNGASKPKETLGGDGAKVDRWTFYGKAGTRIAIIEETDGQAKIVLSTPGKVSATLTDAGGGKIELYAGGSTVRIDGGGVSIDTGGKVKVKASKVDITAGSVKVDAAMSTFTGVVKCDTLIATTVVASTYTPGAGNIW